MKKISLVILTFMLVLSFVAPAEAHSGRTDSSGGLSVGSTTAYTDESILTISVAPITVNGSTMIPARFVTETFGAEVIWENDTRTIYINSK